MRWVLCRWCGLQTNDVLAAKAAGVRFGYECGGGSSGAAFFFREGES